MKSQSTENNNLEIIKRQDFLIYQDDNGVSRVNVPAVHESLIDRGA